MKKVARLFLLLHAHICIEDKSGQLPLGRGTTRGGCKYRNAKQCTSRPQVAETFLVAD